MPERENKQVGRKVTVSVLLAGVYLWLPAGAAHSLAASAGSGWYTHLSCQWAHAGLFHMALNLYALWPMRFTWKELATAYLVSIPATFASVSGVVGFSSVIYALAGMKLPQTQVRVRDWVLFLSLNAATAFIPSVAFGVHAVAFALGLLYAKIKAVEDGYRRACQGK